VGFSKSSKGKKGKMTGAWGEKILSEKIKKGMRSKGSPPKTRGIFILSSERKYSRCYQRREQVRIETADLVPPGRKKGSPCFRGGPRRGKNTQMPRRADTASAREERGAGGGVRGASKRRLNEKI